MTRSWATWPSSPAQRHRLGHAYVSGVFSRASRACGSALAASSNPTTSMGSMAPCVEDGLHRASWTACMSAVWPCGSGCSKPPSALARSSSWGIVRSGRAERTACESAPVLTPCTLASRSRSSWTRVASLHEHAHCKSVSPDTTRLTSPPPFRYLTIAVRSPGCRRRRHAFGSSAVACDNSLPSPSALATHSVAHDGTRGGGSSFGGCGLAAVVDSDRGWMSVKAKSACMPWTSAPPRNASACDNQLEHTGGIT